MAANKMDEILKHFPDLEEGWKKMEEKLKTEPAEREMLSLKYREMLQRESSKESLAESEFTKVKRAESFEVKEVQEEPVSEDLEEAIKVCSEKAMLHKAYTSSPFFSEEDYAKGFVDGKDWQKQQLMKQAIEVQVNPLLGETFVGCKVSGYEVGEKVKIIIIKEGEKC